MIRVGFGELATALVADVSVAMPSKAADASAIFLSHKKTPPRVEGGNVGLILTRESSKGPTFLRGRILRYLREAT